VNLLWAAAVTLAAVVFAVAAILLVRRRAPEGSYFSDGDRAAGFFGVLAAGFAILLGFVVFLAFASFDQSRSGAETEALVVVQQFETAQFLPPATGRRLGGELVCYARSVVHQEWPRMEAGSQGDVINPWSAAQFRSLKRADPSTATQQSAFDKWLDQTSDREQARSDRIHGAAGVIPDPLWVVLIFSALAIFVYMLFFADRGERAVVQGMMIGTVAGVIVATLILIRFLDSPYHPGYGSLKPVAMERTLDLLDQARVVVGDRRPLPCDDSGAPL
jgi:hypothetical protein